MRALVLPCWPPAVAVACPEHRKQTTRTSNTSITGTTRTVCR